ncbi:DUF262 domain-containing protein [Cupriavidus sp. TMH.W2]|uniref:DUF262 domain-containing protein n=1 Tax=Cupriavidus sp. TMH.W2 TaxID=3434465 RepID=UPI003D78066B
MSPTHFDKTNGSYYYQYVLSIDGDAVIPLPQPLLSGTHRSFDIDYLQSGTAVDTTRLDERRILNLVLPPWQRDEVWTDEQKRRFVEGVFLGLGTGFYVINGCDWGRDGKSLPMSGWLIDGQQRMSAIRDFLNDSLSIFNGVRFSMLDRPTALRRFLRVQFPCIELAYTDDEEKLKELYDRLNFGGTPHTAEERVLSTCHAHLG